MAYVGKVAENLLALMAQNWPVDTNKMADVGQSWLTALFLISYKITNMTQASRVLIASYLNKNCLDKFKQQV